jgi:hypothetical protein
MLTISIDSDGRLTATQRDFSPTVYLDHWALRELSTTMLAERFVAELKQRKRHTRIVVHEFDRVLQRDG